MAEQVALEEVRDHVGTAPDDEVIYAALNRFDDADPYRVVRAALVILRRRLADLEGDYASFKVEGDAAYSNSPDNAKALRARIAALQRACGDAENPTDALPVVASAPIHAPPGARSEPARRRGCR